MPQRTQRTQRSQRFSGFGVLYTFGVYGKRSSIICANALVETIRVLVVGCITADRALALLGERNDGIVDDGQRIGPYVITIGGVDICSHKLFNQCLQPGKECLRHFL